MYIWLTIQIAVMIRLVTYMHIYRWLCLAISMSHADVVQKPMMYVQIQCREPQYIELRRYGFHVPITLL